jgi:hypothetical protein
MRNCDFRSDAVSVCKWLIEHKYLSQELSILGGEATIHPEFKWSIEQLCKHFYITVTTNLFSGLFNDMGRFIAWASEHPIRWNTSFHPNQGMLVELYIERVRMMKQAGLYVDQVSSVDTPDLTADIIEKLLSANIGWSLQYATLIDEQGVLLPKTKKDIRVQYPMRWHDYGKYIDENYNKYYDMCSQKHKLEVKCKTDRLLISPDDNIYRCSAHAYRMPYRYKVGSVHNVVKVSAGFEMLCTEYGYCEPCDVGNVEVRW